MTRAAGRPEGRGYNQMTSKMGYLYGIGETSPCELLPHADARPFGDEMTDFR